MAPITVTESQMTDARRVISWGVVQAVQVDNKDPVSGDLQEVMERCVQDNLLQCEKWSKTLMQDLLACNTAATNIRILNDHMADYLTQSFRQRSSSLSSGAFAQGKPNEPHMNILRKMNYEITRHLKLEGTTLLDRLYECDLMSESDRKSIVTKTTERRKNEAFIEYLCSNFTTEKFKASILPVLREDEVHTDLAERLAAELESASTNSGTIRCTFCRMTAIVSTRKFSEVLFELGSISLSVKHDLCLSTQPNSSKWELLLKNVQKEKKLLDALEKSYGHLFTEFQETGHPVLRCCCFNLRSGVAEMADLTLNDIDMTSEAATWTCTQTDDDQLEPEEQEVDGDILANGATHCMQTTATTEVYIRTDKQEDDLLEYVEHLASISDLSKYILKQEQVLMHLSDEYFTKKLQLSTKKDSSTITYMNITKRLDNITLLVETRKNIIDQSRRFKNDAQNLKKEIAKLEVGCDATKLMQQEDVLWKLKKLELKLLEENYIRKIRPGKVCVVM